MNTNIASEKANLDSLSAPSSVDNRKLSKASGVQVSSVSGSANTCFHILGPLLIWLGFLLGLRIEYTAVQQYRRLTIGLHHVSYVESTADLSKHMNQLIFLSTVNHTSTSIRSWEVQDPIFEISRNSIRLKRHVEIYQWVERKRIHKMKMEESHDVNEDGTKKGPKHAAPASVAGGMMSKYHYEQKWVSQPQSDLDFKYLQGHRNIGSLPIPSETFWTSQMELEMDNMVLVIDDRAMLEQLRQPVRISLQGSNTDDLENRTIVKRIPERYHLSGNSLFLRTNEEIPIDNTLDEKQLDLDKTRIIEAIIKMDGEEKTLHQVVATGESFSTRALAEEAVLMLWVNVQTLILDGEERTLYQVEEDSYSSRMKALEHAARLKQQEQDWIAQLPAAQRNKKYRFLPQIGDVRVQFSEVSTPTNISIVAQLILNKDGNYVLQPWIPSGGRAPGIALLSEGYCSADELFARAQRDTVLITWMGRFAAWLLGMIGVVFVTHFNSRLAFVATLVVLFRDVLGLWGTHLLLPVGSGMVAFSVIWTWTRPILGIMTAFAVLSVALLIYRGAKPRDGKAKVE